MTLGANGPTQSTNLAVTSAPAGDAPRPFSDRHLGARATDTQLMLQAIGVDSLEQLMRQALPENVVATDGLTLANTPSKGLSENEALSQLRQIAAKNQMRVQMIGQGYYDTVTPAVIRRNVAENPAWYTAYTPYQAEISQGWLEALMNFQQVVIDLTGLPIANASLLDEATAVAESVLVMRRANKKGSTVVLDTKLHPQIISVVRSRAVAMDFRVEVADLAHGLVGEDIFGVVCAQVATTGEIRDFTDTVRAAKERGALVTFQTDLLALSLMKAPGELGADIAAGSAQRLGVPLFFGGPHAGFMSVTSNLRRQLPGRLVGVSTDPEGKAAYRLALQTREQHIRREKATSNITTAQALLADMAGFYAVYHGPVGLRRIASRIHRLAHAFAAAAGSIPGAEVPTTPFFDTVTLGLPDTAAAVAAADAAGINIRLVDSQRVGVSFGESHTVQIANTLLEALGATERIDEGEFEKAGETASFGSAHIPAPQLPENLVRTSEFLTHPTFNSYGSESDMMRYLRTLADRDLALDRTMIPLGSCTMKLNAAAEMEAITWPEFASIHPYAPAEQTQGWAQLLSELEDMLAQITGYAKVSLQPNAGSQGELAGLLAFKAYHAANGQAQRDTILIPASAHGTNASSGALAGFTVVTVGTADDGSIDVDDLGNKIEQYGDRVAGIMITYPSTHGVFEADVRKVCDMVHAAGGQVYIDGANLNATIGWAKLGQIGGDASHLNLHKTFAIPHGGGGPGVGPIAVGAHLVDYLPGNPLDAQFVDGESTAGLPVSGAVQGSAGVTPISWAYIKLMGVEGLRAATEHSLLTANYVSKELADYFPTLYTGTTGFVAHECILDLHDITAKYGVSAEDLCKRLMDFGFHAPTLAFPVAGTVMFEPTESESKKELDRFITAMKIIYEEITAIGTDYTYEESPLANAPHTATVVLGENWDRKYSREKAVFPAPGLKLTKYFPPVGRINNALGDRKLVPFCPPLEAFDIDADFDLVAISI